MGASIESLPNELRMEICQLSGFSALSRLARLRSMNGAAELVMYRRDIEESIPHGSRALLWAAQENMLATMDKSIAFGGRRVLDHPCPVYLIPLNATYGESLLTYEPPMFSAPLFVAAYYGHDNIVRCLIWEGASMEGWPNKHLRSFGKYKSWSLHSNKYSTPLYAAVAEGRKSTARILYNTGSLQGASVEYSTLILAGAIIRDHEEIVTKILLNHDYDLQMNNLMRFTALELAAETGHFHYIPMLIAAGARVYNYVINILASAKDEEMAIPAICAVLEATPEVNQWPDRGYEALETAAAYCRIKILRLLLAHGADPNMHSRIGNSPLYPIASRAVSYLGIQEDPLTMAQPFAQNGEACTVPGCPSWNCPVQPSGTQTCIARECVETLVQAGAVVDIEIVRHFLERGSISIAHYLLPHLPKEALGSHKWIRTYMKLSKSPYRPELMTFLLHHLPPPLRNGILTYKCTITKSMWQDAFVQMMQGPAINNEVFYKILCDNLGPQPFGWKDDLIKLMENPHCTYASHRRLLQLIIDRTPDIKARDFEDISHLCYHMARQSHHGRDNRERVFIYDARRERTHLITKDRLQMWRMLP